MKETLYKYLATSSGGVTIFGALEAMIVALILSIISHVNTCNNYGYDCYR